MKSIEILDYRETHGGEIRLAAWRRQFVGKTAQAPVKLDQDIKNISGATLSSKHITGGVKRLLVGVFSPDWLEPLARVLGTLGAERAWLMHGSDGLDEITTTGPTSVVAWDHGTIRHFTIAPEDYGLTRVGLADLKGGDAAHNAVAVRDVLDGAKRPYRDIAALNAAAGLVVADRAPDLASGLRLAFEAIDSGQARDVLNRLIRMSQDNILAAAG